MLYSPLPIEFKNVMAALLALYASVQREISFVRLNSGLAQYNRTLPLNDMAAHLSIRPTVLMSSTKEMASSRSLVIWAMHSDVLFRGTKTVSVDEAAFKINGTPP